MPRSRKALVRTAAVSAWLAFFSASPASAAPVTLKFDTTGFTFNDLEYRSLGCIPALASQCALADGLTALGITFDNPASVFGTNPPIFWSFTIDDNNQGGISVTGQLTLGPNSYDISAASGSIGGGALQLFGSLTGPPLASSHGYTPMITGFQFFYGSAGFTSSQVSSTNWTNPALFAPSTGTGGITIIRSDPDNHHIFVGPRLVRVTVPEPSSLMSLSSAVLAFVVWNKRRSRHS